MEINIKALLNFLKIKKKANRDWSKSDQVVLDNFQELKKKGLENLQIQPLNQSSYGDRRFYNNVSPDFQGPSGYAGQGTQDRMPGTTPQFTVKPTKVKRPMKRKGSDYI
jgi:hypothetical protein